MPSNASSAARLKDERGSTALASLVALAMSMALFVACLNVMAVMYAKGVLRGALDDGVRAAAIVGGARRDCEARINDALGDLLAGEMGSSVRFRCAVTSASVEAEASARFPGWLPGIPTANVRIEATAVRERGVSS